MNDTKNKTLNKPQKNASASEAKTSGEVNLTQNKTAVKKNIQKPKAAAPQAPSNPMPGMDAPTRLQGLDAFDPVQDNSPIQKALSSEFAQGIISAPKKLLTAYQDLSESDSDMKQNNFVKQFALVILCCFIFYVWTLARAPYLFEKKAVTSNSHALLVDIIELIKRGENKKAKVLLKRAAQLESDEKLAKKLEKLSSKN